MRRLFVTVVVVAVLCLPSGLRAQSSTPIVVDSLVNAYSLYGTGHTPFVYTRVGENQFYTLIKRGGVVGSPTEGGNSLFIVSSQDNGLSWTLPLGSLTETQEHPAPRYPGVAVLGAQASDATELEYVFHFPYHNNVGDNPWEGQVLGQANSQYSGSGQWFTATVDRPMYNGKEMILATYCELVASPDASVSLMAGDFIVDEGELPEQANVVGIVRFDVAKDQFPAVSFPWDMSEFNVDNTSFAETNVQIGLGLDKQEVAYLMLNARLATREASMPAEYTSFNGPILATTSDYGQTWSEWDAMPIELFSQFLALHAPESGEWSKASSFFAFNQTEMVVVAENHVIGICSIALSNEDGTETELHIVEVEWKDGTWALRSITVENYTPYLRNEFGSTATSASQKRNELEIAVTEDREYVVAKWLGFGNNPDNISNIHVSYRKIGEPEWSLPANTTTGTDYIVKCSYMPKVVPSVSSVPLIRAVSIPQPGEMDSDAIQADIWHPQHIVMWFADATAGTNSVHGRTVENIEATFSPHPVTVEAKVSIELPTQSTGEVQIWSLSGELMQTVYSGLLHEGQNEWRIQAGSMANGTYLLRIVTDSRVFQSSFVIQK